ncbi:MULTISPECIES: hypothetical protein [Haloprofundus]|uniref:hypothetical protein n=1 Tax=Haloprofundus TaxID=1911573 RepID=UPI0010BF5E11|nr:MULTISPECIES: hypothetical protein [Haloprofundus]QCJ47409.1 hypothetical protein FCF25_09900 [Haloprofundus sp. MHR1]
MTVRESLSRRPTEAVALAVFAAGVAAFVILHTVVLVTSRGGDLLAQVRLVWFAFVVAAAVAAAYLVAESTGRL